MNFKTEITKIHYNKNASGIFFKILQFLSLFYSIGTRFKNFLYDKSVIKPKKVNAYVISVGNLTTGGVGKTPVVAELVNYLDCKTAIISRGYGGQLPNNNVNVISDGNNIFYDAKLAGDEPFWLAVNTNAVVITCKNRYKGAKYAIENFGCSAIILDDGFQHRKLYRDMDIVLVDSEKMFGNEHLLPAGPLREGLESFKRIDKFVVVSKNIEHSKAEKFAKVMNKKLSVDSFVCKIEPDKIYNIKTGENLPENELITAVCAIGQPEQFFGFLYNYNVKNKLIFDDHHCYKEAELPSGILVTTEKDAVKMQNFSRNDIYALKLKTQLDAKGVLS